MKKEKPKEKLPVGRPRKVESPDQLLAWFDEYFKFRKANPITVEDWVGKDANKVTRKKEVPITMVGFENFCYKAGYIKDLKDYFSNDDGRYSEYAEVCRFILSMIKEDHVNGGMAGIYNSQITQRLNGMSDNINTTVHVKQITGMKIE